MKGGLEGRYNEGMMGKKDGGVESFVSSFGFFVKLWSPQKMSVST